MLQILDIKKSFGELHVLRGVDLDVEQGDVVAIIGPSGSCLLYTSPSPRD